MSEPIVCLVCGGSTQNENSRRCVVCVVEVVTMRTPERVVFFTEPSSEVSGRPCFTCGSPSTRVFPDDDSVTVCESCSRPSFTVRFTVQRVPMMGEH